MISKLTEQEFIKRLCENVQTGSVNFKLSPFGCYAGFFSNKTFYGLIEQNAFKLVKNSTFFANHVIIDGFFKVDNKSLEINYKASFNTKFLDYLVNLSLKKLIFFLLINIMVLIGLSSFFNVLIPGVIVIFIFFIWT